MVDWRGKCIGRVLHSCPMNTQRCLWVFVHDLCYTDSPKTHDLGEGCRGRELSTAVDVVLLQRTIVTQGIYCFSAAPASCRTPPPFSLALSSSRFFFFCRPAAPRPSARWLTLSGPRSYEPIFPRASGEKGPPWSCRRRAPPWTDHTTAAGSGEEALAAVVAAAAAGRRTASKKAGCGAATASSSAAERGGRPRDGPRPGRGAASCSSWPSWAAAPALPTPPAFPAGRTTRRPPPCSRDTTGAPG